jgi:hypothetical protein
MLVILPLRASRFSAPTLFQRHCRDYRVKASIRPNTILGMRRNPNGFDGVFANATLLHAPPDVFENALRNIALLLKSNGVAALSLKTGEGDEISFEKMDAPRYFRYYTELKIREIFSGLLFEVIDVSHAENGKWLHIIVKVQE